MDSSKETFERDGFVLLQRFLDKSEMEELHENLHRVIKSVVPGMPRDHAFYEDRNRPETLKQLQHLYRYDSFFEKLFRGSKFEALAETLLDGPVVPNNLQYFNKPPGVGQPTPPHQDGYYFMIDPCEAVTMWLALEEVDEENGCVRYVPGSHREGMRPHGRTQTLGFSQGITDFGKPGDREREVAMLAGPGDLLVHQAMTIHRADGNQSTTRTRQALGLIYYSARATEDVAAKEAYLRKLTEENVKAGKL